MVGKHDEIYARLEVLTQITNDISVFWYVMRYTLVYRYTGTNLHDVAFHRTVFSKLIFSFHQYIQHIM
jgi:hypothetical protein